METVVSSTERLTSPCEFVHTLERKFKIFTVLGIDGYTYAWEKMRLMCDELGIEHKFNFDTMLDNDHYSEEITKLYYYIIENEEELILWRLL